MVKNIDIDTDMEITDDKDMEKLLAILHDIPEVPIPEHFESRFSQALAAEGKAIREERMKNTAVKKRNWRLKAAATVAACFVIVFASVSMYNDNGGVFLRPDGTEGAETADAVAPDEMYSAAAGEARENDAEDAENNGENNDKNNKEEQLDIEIVSEEFSGLTTMSAPMTPQIKTNTDDSTVSETSPDLDAGHTQAGEQGFPCREGSKYIGAAAEYQAYKKRIEEYLAGYEFELLNSKRDNTSGNYLFEIRIIRNPEGESVDAPLILIGEQGEIYEQQAEPQPIDSEGEPAKYDPAGEEPQVGSD